MSATRSLAALPATPRASGLYRIATRAVASGPGPRVGGGGWVSSGGSGCARRPLSGAPGSQLWRHQHRNSNSGSRQGQRTAVTPPGSEFWLEFSFWLAAFYFIGLAVHIAEKKYDEWSAAQRQQTAGSVEGELAGGSGSGDATSGPGGMHAAQDMLASGSGSSSSAGKLEEAAMLAAENANLAKAVLVCMEALKQQLAATEARAASAEAAEVESLKKEVKRLTELTQELESEAGRTAAE